MESFDRAASSSNLWTRVSQSPTPGLASLVSGPGDRCCRNRLADGAGTGGRLRLGRELLAHGYLGCPWHRSSANMFFSKSFPLKLETFWNQFKAVGVWVVVWCVEHLWTMAESCCVIEVIRESFLPWSYWLAMSLWTCLFQLQTVPRQATEHVKHIAWKIPGFFDSWSHCLIPLSPTISVHLLHQNCLKGTSTGNFHRQNGEELCLSTLIFP